MTLTRPKVSMLNLDITGTEELLTDTNVDSSAGPTQTLFRDSSSPAANDLLAYLKFDGRDSLGNRQNYASILAQLLDPASGGEDGALFFSTCVASADTVTMTLLGGKVGIGNSAPQAKLHVGAGADTPTAISGTSIPVYVSEAGPTALQVRDSTNNTDISIVANATATRQISNLADGGRHYFEIGNNVIGFTYDNPGGTGSGFVVAGTGYSFGNPQVVGLQMHSDTYSGGGGGGPGSLAITSAGVAIPLAMNRSNGDGTQVEFYSGGSFAGGISVSGGVVTYGSFCGAHLSQLHDQSKQEILRGTILETIDEMCSWALEDAEGEEHNEQLVKFKISDTPGAKAVYGVFSHWDGQARNAPWCTSEEEVTYYAEQDAHVASLGAFTIRLEAGTQPQRGDLIESAGNGCGRIQADDIFRASTVAKITAAVVIETYPDGSFLVPCTLHCG